MQDINLVSLCFITLCIWGCRKQVSRIETEQSSYDQAAMTGTGTKNSHDRRNKAELSGRFSSVDSNEIAGNIVRQLLTGCYLFQEENSREKNVIAVGQIKNKSHEHIVINTFMNEIERALINSGKCKVIANKQIRESIKNEVDDYKGDSEAIQKRCLSNLGVNMMIFGEFSDIVDQEGKEEVKYYQFDIELIDIATNEKLWMGTHRIKKYIKG